MTLADLVADSRDQLEVACERPRWALATTPMHFKIAAAALARGAAAAGCTWKFVNEAA